MQLEELSMNILSTAIKSLALTVSGTIIAYGTYAVIHGTRIAGQFNDSFEIRYVPNQLGWFHIILGGLVAGGLVTRQLPVAWAGVILLLGFSILTIFSAGYFSLVPSIFLVLCMIFFSVKNRLAKS
jgi:hypothetical protein